MAKRRYPGNGDKDPRDKVASKERPKVTAASKQKYTDYGKKEQQKHGVGAKLGAPGTSRRAEQVAVARDKVARDKSKKGQFNFATTSEVEEAKKSAFRNKAHMKIKKKVNGY